ncbi:fMet-Leu-Phe receptor-like [Leptodactylus fuscus]|uniref:fMet-Leu-Phe receptor-like n=1 Tax=Leptodactylus fuscus TaxID=238119 RepID=UPI003F4EB6AA
MDPAGYNLTSPNTTLDYNNQSSQKLYEASSWQNTEDILQKISFCLYGITFVLGIIGNGLVIWIAGFRMKKTISAVWFLHLAVADLLCCASILVRFAEELHVVSYIPNVNPFCMLIMVLFVLNMNASVLLLTAMSIDRCVSVVWPFWTKVHRTRRLVRITAGGIWGLSLLLTALVCYSCGWCITSRNDNDETYKHNLQKITWPIRLVIMFVIPFLIILTTYVTILIKLRRSKRPQRSQRPYRIITAVIVCFFICWSPYYFWPLSPMNQGDYCQFHIVNTIVLTLARLNSCVNPIIYVFMGQDFRTGFFRSIPARLERALSEHPDYLSRNREGLEHKGNKDVA